jgi:hypothetical protein
MQLNASGQQAALIDATNGQQRTSHAVMVAPNSAEVQQPQDEPCSLAALMRGPAATAGEVRAEPESRTHGRRKRSGQGPQPHSSKRQRQRDSCFGQRTA